MSCISSNFSSFFLNSLNDPSEFSKYLSNGELRFSSTFEDFQVYNNSSAQQQYQQQPQLYHLNGNAGGLQANGGGDPMNSGDDGNSNLENTQPTSLQHYGSYQQQQQQQQQQQPPQHANNHPSTHPLVHLQQHQQRWTSATHPHHVPQHAHGHGGHPTLAPPPGAISGPATAAGSTAGAHQPHFDGSFEFMKYLRHSNDYNENSHDGGGPHRHPHHHHASNASSGPTAIGTKSETSLNANNASLIDLDTTPHKVSRSSRKTPAMSSSNHSNSNSNSSNAVAAAVAASANHPTPMAVDVYDHDSKHTLYDLHHMNSAHSSNSNESSMELSSLTYPNSHLNASNSNTSSEGGTNQGHNDFSMLSVAAGTTPTAASATAAGGNTDAAAAAASPAAPKPLATFAITENFEAHPSHKVEEGIFQHMNKLPAKKKENLKTLGVRFTGQMTLNDKSIIVDNFIKFCQEYDIQDHRPFLSLNQSGLNKPDQIKFARYLGQGLPTFTLFCIYSNFKNLFCTKRTEIYTKDGYNLPYILEKTKSFLANTAADLKNIINQQSNDGMDFVATTPTNASGATVAAATATAPATPMITNQNSNSNNTNMNPLTTLPPPLIPTQQQQQPSQQQHSPTSVLNPMMVDYNHSNSMMPPTSTSVPTAAAVLQPLGAAAASSSTRPLENLMIFDNFDVHETHRIEDGICTQLSRLPPKKQELLKQFGIQTNQTVTYYEKYILIENFNRFCNEYKVADHRPFLDLSESGLPKSEQLKFIRYLGQGLPNLTLNKIYLVFKDILGLSRIEKMALEGYNLDAILKKKKKNLYNRMTAAAVHKECNPDVPTPAIPTAAVTQPTTATAPAPKPAPALMPIYHQDAYKT